MFDYLDRLAKEALDTIRSDYYETTQRVSGNKIFSLKESLIYADGNPVIAEIKAASPSKGKIREKIDPVVLAEKMMKGGAAGLSVLTEPKHFHGSIEYISDIREIYPYPILMKDFILSEQQLRSAIRSGASAILLIYTLFDRGYPQICIDEMIEMAHGMGLEVLLETHSVEEFKAAISTEADLIGINNRDLRTLEIDIRLTESILSSESKGEKLVVSESGIKSQDDIRFLRCCGADAYLVGSSIMEHHDPERKVRKLVTA